MVKISPQEANDLKRTGSTEETKLVGTHWGLYQIGKDGGLSAFATDPDPAQFGLSLHGDSLAACRIKKPAVRRSFLEQGAAARQGRRGAEPFVEVSWDEALDLVVGEIKRVRDRYGNSSMFSGSYGWASAGRFHHAQGQLKRFFNLAGGSARSQQTYSYAAGEVLLPHILGSTNGLVTGHTPWNEIAGHSELIVMFGGTPLRNAQVSSGGVVRHSTRDALQECKEKGAHFINVSPVDDDAAASLGAEWIALRPNTDTALMLALAHELIAQGRYDTAFMARYTSGFEKLKNYITGAVDGIAKDSHWASLITGLEAAVIRDLAHRMATHKTFIMVAWSLQRADHGEQPYWAATALACLLGGIGLPGRGIGFGYACAAAIGQPPSLVDWPSFPQGQNPVKASIPVARVTDMLLSPGERYDHNGESHYYPDTKLIYWAGGNPFHHHQDLNRLVEAWQLPETIIVHDHWWNAHARHADIVLPVATFFERDDIAARGRSNFLAYSRAVSAPPVDVPTDHVIFKNLAARLGFENHFTEGLDEEGWLRRLYEEASASARAKGVSLPAFEAFREIGLVEVPVQEETTIFLENFRANPEQFPLKTPTGRIELYSEPIAGYGYDDCPGHASWLEPREWLGSEQAKRFPLHLLSCQPHDKLHSQWDHAAPSRETKRDGRQPVRINPVDAIERAIAHGDVVEIFNERGRCLAIATLTDSVRSGVIQLATGAWFDPERPETSGSLELNGNPNVLTPDHGTSQLAQGPSPNSCLVEMKRVSGKVPASRAYRSPDLVDYPLSKKL